ncbi:hypothetical protein ACWCP6_06465 [Streptomyces sp. NPDC002004]
MNADPLPASPTPRVPDDVRLRAGSPARGAGTVSGDGTAHDYFGNPILVPSNIGADQSRGRQGLSSNSRRRQA